MLKKKQVVEILGVALIAFLLGTIVNVNLLTIAGKEEEDDGPPTWSAYVSGLNASALPESWEVNANVTNWPVDEEGNLRVTHEPSWKVISLVENFELTWTPSLDPKWVYSDKIDLGSVFVGGYSRMKLYMWVTDFTILYQGSPNEAFVLCSLKSLYDYGEISAGSCKMGWSWETTTQSLYAEYPSTHALMRETVEPSLRITVRGASLTPNGPVLPFISCLVSIGIYLRNE